MSARTATSGLVETDHEYNRFEEIVKERLTMIPRGTAVFQAEVNVDHLWAAYLMNIPEVARQHYNCRCCRQFIERFGSLVLLSADGHQQSILWRNVDEFPMFFQAVVAAMCNIVEAGRVAGVFLSVEETFGTPVSPKGWTHLCGPNNNQYNTAPGSFDADQKVAELREDFNLLNRTVADYSLPVAEEALRILKGDAVVRAEKAVQMQEWFVGALTRLESQKGNLRRNIAWVIVATAPPGFVHVKNNMPGTLMDAVKNGTPISEITRAWAEKMNPLQYQRKTAEVTDGQINEAERLIEQMGIALSLRRRFATLDDVPKQYRLWTHKELVDLKPVDDGRLFDSLRKKSKTVVTPADLPARVMSFEKFIREILPAAVRIDIKVKAIGGYYGLVTADNPTAPPIIQWDGFPGEPRNPVAWYVWNGGSYARSWGLKTNDWVKVNAVFYGPHMWQRPDLFKHHTLTVMFAIEGCAETKNPGLSLFPEILKAELRPARAVIEKFSATEKLTNWGQPISPSAAGLLCQKLQDNMGTSLELKVFDGKGNAFYKLDRWD